jgi:hypothetical protein
MVREIDALGGGWRSDRRDRHPVRMLNAQGSGRPLAARQCDKNAYARHMRELLLATPPDRHRRRSRISASRATRSRGCSGVPQGRAVVWRRDVQGHPALRRSGGPGLIDEPSADRPESLRAPDSRSSAQDRHAAAAARIIDYSK